MLDPSTQEKIPKMEEYAGRMVETLDGLGFESCVYVCFVEKETGEGGVVGAVSENSPEEFIKTLPHEIAVYNEDILYGE